MVTLFNRFYGQTSIAVPHPQRSAAGGEQPPGTGHISRLGSSDASEFPIRAFPNLAREFIERGSAARGIPLEFVAMPLLACTGAVIGNRLRLQIKRGWQELPIVWSVVVGPPGSGKTPGQTYASQSLRAVRHVLRQSHVRDLAAWRTRSRDQGEEQGRPIAATIVAKDFTMESLAPLLERRSGLLLARDEVAGWPQSFNAYRKGGGDRERWLELWSGESIRIDRKMAEPIEVLDPVICVAGGTQPGKLPVLISSAVDDGFAARMWIASPRTSPPQWSDEEDDDEVVSQLADHFLILNGMQKSVVSLTDEALNRFKSFHKHNGEITEASDDIAASWSSKAPNHLARAALLLHALESSTDPTSPLAENTMIGAIELIEYLRQQMVILAPVLGSADLSAQERNLKQVQRNLEATYPDWIARSELMNRTRLNGAKLSTSLDLLKQWGRAESRSVSTSARPREEWRIVPADIQSFQSIQNIQERD
jgi:hypothetical protein